MPDDHPFSTVLEGMREIALPEAVSAAPQTIGWWILLAVLLIVMGLVAWRMWRRHRRNAYRRLGLARLDGIATHELPALVKRTALDAYGREEVASLTDAAWLAFLDHAYGGTGFSNGPGRVLPALAYDAATALSEGKQRELTDLIRTWIKRHRV